MKTKAKNLWNSIFVLFFVGLGFSPLFSQQGIPILYNFQEDKLTVRLELNADQIDSLKKLGNMLQSQATQDRQNFKGNAQALLAAAERRALMADNLLTTLLDDSQKLKLKALKEEQISYRDVFVLKEVLVLDELQTAKVQLIIENYTLQPDEIDSHIAQNSGELRENPDEIGGRDLNRQGMDRMDGRGYQANRGMRPAEDALVDLFKEQERKKQKAIEALLTPEQKVSYTQLKEILRKEFDLRMAKLKETKKE